MSGLPWSKFFWSDYAADPALKLCSLSAQGLWMRMLCIAAEHEPVGYVAINGEGLDQEGIASLCGKPVAEIETALAELERRGVFSRDRRGWIYSRRLVNDAKVRRAASEHGKKGGNPNLRKQSGKAATLKGSPKGEDKGRDKADPKPQRPEAKRNLSVSRARNIPEDWKPEPFGEGTDAAAIVGGWSAEHLQSQVERFADHHRAKGSKFADWQAAWGTWVRNSVKFGQARFSSGGSDDRYSFIDQAARDIEQRKRALTTQGAG